MKRSYLRNYKVAEFCDAFPRFIIDQKEIDEWWLLLENELFVLFEKSCFTVVKNN